MTKDAALKLGLQLVATAEYLATDAEICGKDAKEERALIQRSKIAFEEALAQPEQEPVAMRFDFDGYGWLYIDNGSGSNWKEKIKNAEPLYTTPPQRKPLTDKQIGAILEDPSIAEKHQGNWLVLPYAYARAIEAAHGIKGE